MFLANIWTRPANHKLLVIAALAVVVSAIYLAFRLQEGAQVRAFVVERGTLAQTIVATGRVESLARIEVAAVGFGTVARVFVNEGDHVVAGQRLLELDSRQARAEWEQAKANLVTAQARLEQLEAVGAPLAAEAEKQARATLILAQTKFEHAQELFRGGHIGQSQLDDARLSVEIAQSVLNSALMTAQSRRAAGSDYKLAHASVEEAKARLKLVEAQLSNWVLLSPVAGTVITRLTEVGASAQPGKPLLVLVQQGALRAVADVDEKNLRYLKQGLSAWISADAFSTERIPAKLDFIAPTVDAARGTVQIKLAIPNAPPYLRPDMTMALEIVVGNANQVLSLPNGAVHDMNSAKPWVMVPSNGVAERRDVTLGLKGEGAVEVTSGLSAGEVVIAASELKAALGSRVRPALAGRN